MTRPSLTVGTLAVLGLLAACVIPACRADGPQAGIPSVAVALGRLLTWQMPALVALLAWPLLSSERFRRRAPLVAVLLLAVHVLIAWNLEPFTQLLQARTLMRVLGSDEAIRDLVPATWTLSDVVSRLDIASPATWRALASQRLVASTWTLVALLPLLLRRHARSPLLAPLAVLCAVVLPAPSGAGGWFAPWPLAIAALAHGLPPPRRHAGASPTWFRVTAGLAACLGTYVGFAGAWTWRQAFDAPTVTRPGQRLQGTLRRLDGGLERIGFGGGPVLILTWSSSCPGSPAGLARAAEIARRAGPGRLRVLGLVLGGREDAEAFGRERLPAEIIPVMDPGEALPLDRRAGTPGWYLVDGDGTLFQQVPTEHLGDPGQIERALDLLASRR